jgi:type IV pilus biogenesis protein CpaD/CtpE
MQDLFRSPITGRIATSVLVAAFFTTLVGCASSPEAPTASLTMASDTIANAERSGARQYAGAELDEAKEKLTQAEDAVISEEMTEAERLAEQANIVAELAIARTEAAKASEINRQLTQDADALDVEMKRTGEQR